MIEDEIHFSRLDVQNSPAYLNVYVVQVEKN